MDKIVIWGIGNIGRGFICKLTNCEIVAYVDKNPELLYYKGLPVVRPEELTGISFDYVIVTPIESEGIAQFIKSHDYERERFIFLFFFHHSDNSFWLLQFFQLKKYLSVQDMEELQPFDMEYISQYYDLEVFDGHAIPQPFDECVRKAKAYGTLRLFNYDYGEYIYNTIVPCWDEGLKQYFVYTNGIKFFYPPRYNQKRVLLAHRDYLIQNDQDSPLVHDVSYENQKNILVVGVSEAVFLALYSDGFIEGDVFVLDKEWAEAIRTTVTGLDVSVYSTYDELPDKQYDLVRINMEEYAYDVEEIVSRIKANRLDIIVWDKDKRDNTQDVLNDYSYQVIEAGGYVYCPDPYEFLDEIYFKKGMLTCLKKERK